MIGVELSYIVTESGAVYAAALDADGAIVAASDPLDDDDTLDPNALRERSYCVDLGAALDAEYDCGRAARILAHFTLTV
jgi:hypothetical protein